MDVDLKNNIKYRRDYQKPHFAIDKTELCFKLYDDFTLIDSKLHCIRVGSDASDDLVLDGEQLELLSIKLDGKTLTDEHYSVDENSLTIRSVPQEFVVSIQVKVYPEKNKALEGLYLSNGKYCTQCEAEGFRKITYFLDRPDVLSSYQVRIEADQAAYPYLLSNGNNIEKGVLDNGRHFAVWQDPFKKPCYLFALCAGDYDLLEDRFETQSGRSVLLQIYVDKGRLSQCYHAMASLKKSMVWDEKVFNLEYDLDSYMIVAVGDFNMGAMENKGLNIFITKYVLAAQNTATDDDFEDVEAVIAHEYFHNWTGNRVTCRDWFQLSLKEGLTVFRDQLFTADQTDHATKRIHDVKVLRSHQFAEDAGPMAHPIRPDSYIEMNNFYTVTVYNKGAEIIRMMHTLLGENGFLKGMQLYFERHDGQAVTCEDFIQSMEDANKYDLSQFRLWYSQAGTPSVNVKSFYDERQSRLTLTFEQSSSPSPGQPDKKPFHIPITLALLNKKGQEMDLDVDLPECLQGNIFHLKEKSQSIIFSHIKEKPLLSLLRHFSAPVKLFYDYTDSELSGLFAKDNDAFNRWDAGQRLFTRVIWQLYESCVNQAPMVLPDYLLDAVQSVLAAEDLDGNFKALALKLPDIKTLLENVHSVDIDKLIQVRKFLKQQLGEKLEMDWLLHYQANHHIGEFKQDKLSVSKRAYSAVCLDYLMELEKEEVYELAIKQLDVSNNMTDTIVALKLLLHSQYPSKHQLADEFYQKWQNEELVINKWLKVLATAPSDETLNTVTRLLEHPSFEITNPNKVGALIGAFSSLNMQQFHRYDGLGYQFLAEQIKLLYAINPQTAARLTGAFNQWKKFDSRRQELMSKELKGILQLPSLSRDVYEIASKALA